MQQIGVGKGGKKIRIGLLGAAWITKAAIIDPAKLLTNSVEIYAIAARDKQRAINYAKKHKIPHVFNNYNDLINDPAIDVIYNPLPNSHHCEWTIKALNSGKHVLCEKPFANNAEEAFKMIETAQKTGKFLYEAFHYRHHPFIQRIKSLISTENEIGSLKNISATFCIPIFKSSDIRYNYSLGGGAMMDTGSYVMNVLRYLSEGEPVFGYVTPQFADIAFSPKFSVDQSMWGSCHFVKKNYKKLEKDLKNYQGIDQQNIPNLIALFGNLGHDNNNQIDQRNDLDNNQDQNQIT